jgi:UDP-N-acetylglucosamine acyltransferase
LRGVNSVGLRRANLPEDSRRALKQSFRLLVRSGLSLSEAIQSINEIDDPFATHLVKFITDSKRGFVGAHRQTKNGAATDFEETDPD